MYELARLRLASTLRIIMFIIIANHIHAIIFARTWECVCRACVCLRMFERVCSDAE